MFFVMKITCITPISRNDWKTIEKRLIHMEAGDFRDKIIRIYNGKNRQFRKWVPSGDFFDLIMKICRYDEVNLNSACCTKCQCKQMAYRHLGDGQQNVPLWHSWRHTMRSRYITVYLFHNNLRATPIARPNGRAMHVFRDNIVRPKFYLRT